MLERAIAISEQHLSADHSDLAINRHNLAKLYSAQGKYQQAESLLLRVITQWEQSFGPEHHNLAIMVLDLGRLYERAGRLDEAEQHSRRALAIYETAVGPHNPKVAEVRAMVEHITAARASTAQA